MEHGADPTPLVAPVVEFLQRVAPLAADFHDACIAQIPADADDRDAEFRQAAVRLRSEMPKAAEAWVRLKHCHVAVVAVLAASPAARAQSRSIALKNGSAGIQRRGLMASTDADDPRQGAHPCHRA